MRNEINDLSFDELAYKYAFLTHDLMALFEVDKRTLNNWLSKNSAPIYARKLLSIIGRGYLPCGDEWTGFEIRGQLLYTPAGQRISASNVLAWFFKEQLINHYQNVNRRLTNENARLQRIATSSNESIFNQEGLLKQMRLFND